jgi:DedD protein
MADNDDVNTLKRRGRRRLAGAIALVLAAVIVLPMVFDSEPKGSAPPVSVRIPGEDDTAFAPKVTPKPPANPAQDVPVPEKAVEKAPEKSAEKAPEKAPETLPEKPASKSEVAAIQATGKPAAGADAEKLRAEAALAGGQFAVSAGAYAEPAGVIEKLKAAKIPYYTEPVAVKGGSLTRVRAGPFASQAAAEKAAKQLKDLGLKPGNVVPKS